LGASACTLQQAGCLSEVVVVAEMAAGVGSDGSGSGLDWRASVGGGSSGGGGGRNSGKHGWQQVRYSQKKKKEKNKPLA
jgi:hypothetical protein